MQILAFLHRVPRRWRALGVSLAALFLLDLSWILWRFPAGQAAGILTADRIQAPGAPVLVLGAGVYADGEPTEVLEGRLEAALDLYRSGRTPWFLVSGDNRRADYNEPQAMRRWLVKRGVPRTRIVEDYGGRRTYDSLRRAAVVFGVRRCIIVTSDFHLPRALYLARAAGVEAVGIPSSTQEFKGLKRLNFWAREYIARHRALLDAWFPPDPVLGPREATPADWLTP